MLRKFDVCLSPSDEPLCQWVIESDAAGEFEALRNVRAIYGGTVKINSITPHEEKKSEPVTITIRIKNFVNDYLNTLFGGIK